MPEGVQHLKGDVQQVLVEEVHHVLAQAVAPLQCVTRPPAVHNLQWGSAAQMAYFCALGNWTCVSQAAAPRCLACMHARKLCFVSQLLWVVHCMTQHLQQECEAAFPSSSCLATLPSPQTIFVLAAEHHQQFSLMVHEAHTCGGLAQLEAADICADALQPGSHCKQEADGPARLNCRLQAYAFSTSSCFAQRHLWCFAV